MNLRRLIVWVVFGAVAVTVVESSLLVKQSLLRPRIPEPCFSCRAEDRPYGYSLISYLAKVKDMFVRGLNVLLDSTKQYKLDSKL